MRARRVVAFLFLVIAALCTASAAYAADDCRDDCSPVCGDCLGCLPLADQPAMPAMVLCEASVPVQPFHAAPAWSTPRQLDHVPLDALA